MRYEQAIEDKACSEIKRRYGIRIKPRTFVRCASEGSQPQQKPSRPRCSSDYYHQIEKLRAKLDIPPGRDTLIKKNQAKFQARITKSLEKLKQALEEE